LVWFLVAFLLSRSSQVGLPGRFAREAAVPLILAIAVALGYFIFLLRSNYQKFIAIFALGFIIYMNLAQINDGAYRSPDFFNKMVWFDADDKLAAEAIDSVAGENSKIIANPTTPYLPMFAKTPIEFVGLDQLTDATALRVYAKEAGIRYIFIGSKTSANPDEKAYPFFANFDQKTTLLKKVVETCPPKINSNAKFTIYDLNDCPLKTTTKVKR
jgi:hypothetical protein